MTPSQTDLNQAYRRLGLLPGASLEEIKQAFRSLAKMAHPDLNPGQGNDFMAHLNQAYHTLSSRFQDGAVPYRFQDFTFSSAPRPEPSPAGAEAAAPRAQAKPVAGLKTSFEPGMMPLAAAPAAPLGRHFGPLDAPLPGREQPSRQAGFTAAAQPPRHTCRLTGLDRKQGRLVYRLEVTGQPQEAVLPVRTLHGCGQCGGNGLHPSGPGGLCPGCGGAGRIVKPKNMAVALPVDWADGQLLEVETEQGQTVLVELKRSQGMGRA